MIVVLEEDIYIYIFFLLEALTLGSFGGYASIPMEVLVYGYGKFLFAYPKTKTPKKQSEKGFWDPSEKCTSDIYFQAIWVMTSIDLFYANRKVLISL